MQMDDIFRSIGEFGPKQKYYFGLLALTHIVPAFILLQAVFLTPVVKHRCSLPGWDNDTYSVQSVAHEQFINRTIPLDNEDDIKQYDSCNIYASSDNNTFDQNGIPVNATRIECNNWVYDKSVFETSVTSDMNFVCQEKLRPEHAQMIFMGGVLVGSIAFGTISDQIGRKKTLCLSSFLLFSAAFASAWTDGFVSFSILRFAAGASNAGLFTSAFVLAIELVGPSKRVIVGVLGELFFTVGNILLDFIAYFVRDWRTLVMVLSCPTLLYLLCWWLLPESPRWLVSQGRTKEAKEVLARIAKANKKALPDKSFVSETTEVTPKAQLWQIFKYRVLLVRSLIVFFNWLVVRMVYYGLSLNAGNLAGDLYVNFLLNAVVEIPACIACILLLDRLGRKRLYTAGMILGGVACLTTIFPVLYAPESQQGITLTFALIGKLGATAAFIIVYVYSAELFPTVIRNGVIGAGSMSARIGGMVAPYIAGADKFIGGDLGQAVPLIIFGAASVVAGLMALALPETLNMKLPETLEDGVKFGVDNEAFQSMENSADKPEKTQPMFTINQPMNGDMNYHTKL